MKRAVYCGIRDIRVEEVPDPAPGRGEVKIKNKYIGICGSDLHEYLHGLFPASPFGHEACGEIVSVGEGVRSFAAGDRVCSFVKDAYAEYLICPENRLLKIPDGMKWERAALVEPLSGAAYAVHEGGIQASDSILIVGAGTVGLMLLLGLKAMGVEKIYMTDILENRRQKALELGASLVWNPAEVKTSSKIKELTAGKGVDAAIEAVGIETTLKDCLSSVKYKGKVIVQGIFTQRASVHMLGFVTRETTMIGTNSINPPLAMKWLASGKIQPESVITQIIPLDQIKTKGFDILSEKRQTAIKILVEP